MITTIQLRENVKSKLDELKTDNDTYEKVILNLIMLVDKYKRENEALLIEGCKEMAEENLKVTKEWEATDSKLDWSW